MKIFADQHLTEELVEVLPLGIVPAGEVRQFTFWMKNNSSSYLRDLEVIIAHKEIAIIEAPKELLANQTKRLIIEWNCTVELKEGLRVPVEIKADEIVG